MGVAFSFHKGGAGKERNGAITSSKDLKRVDRHNNRKFKNNNKSLILTLEGSQSIFNDVKELYKKEFDETVKKFNQKQTRNDRKINDYFQKINDSKKTDLATEIIIQLGSAENFKNKNFENLDEQTPFKNYYESQLKHFKILFPEFKVANATVHFDEATPHLHIVGVAVAYYDKGLEKRASKAQCFDKARLSNAQSELRAVGFSDLSKINQKQTGRNFNFSVKDYKANIVPFLEQKKELNIEIKEKLEKKNQIETLNLTLEAKLSDLTDELAKMQTDITLNEQSGLKRLETLKKVNNDELEKNNSLKKINQELEQRNLGLSKYDIELIDQQDKKINILEKNLKHQNMILKNLLKIIFKVLKKFRIDVKELNKEILKEFNSEYEKPQREILTKKIKESYEDFQRENSNNFYDFER